MIILIIPLWGCLQTENSSSGDANQYGEGPVGDDIPPDFANVRTIFSSSCAAPCHTYSGFSEEQFVTQGLVVPGDPDNSPIYQSLIGSTAPTGRKDMPLGAGALTPAELDMFVTWINSIAP